VRPPECDVCGDAGPDVGQVRFADPGPDPASYDDRPGHPPGLAWLCPTHVEATRALRHLSFAAARTVVGLTESASSGETSRLSLQWPSGTGGTEGVEVSDDEVLWWSRPGGSGGRFGEAARGQSHDDYRRQGPAVSCPPDVRRQVDRALGLP